MSWINLLFKKHKHTFDIKDVMNTKIDPLCSCGITLSEAEKRITNHLN